MRWDAESDGHPCWSCYPSLTWQTCMCLQGEVCVVYWVLVEGLGFSLMALRFLARDFLSVPSRYFLPVIHKASCFGLTPYFSCISLWVVLPPNFLNNLYARVAAKSHVRLFIISCFMASVVGSGIMVSFTLWWISLEVLLFVGLQIDLSRSFPRHLFGWGGVYLISAPSAFARILHQW